MKNLKALLFDIDGTILDTREFIVQATEHALSFHGHAVPEKSQISKMVGKPFNEFYYRLTGLTAVEHLQKTHREYQLKNLHLSKIFPKAKETLFILRERGYALAAVTTRSKITSLDTLRQAGIIDYFDVIISKEDVTAEKPHPAPLLKALELLREIPERAVMIGDSDVDIEAGKNAGTKTIRVTYGFNTDRLHETHPDHIVHNIQELLLLLA